MALRRQKLIEARLKKNLSQEKLAEQLEVDRASVSNWECGVAAPSLYARGQMQEFFGVDDLDAFLEITEASDKAVASPPLAPIAVIDISPTRPQRFIASNPVRLFWQIAHTDYDNPNQLTQAIGAAIKDLYTMTTGDEKTRREALCELASIPLIAMGVQQTLKTTRYEEMLRYCTAALGGCWELYRGVDPQGAMHAFECCNTYIPLLEMIASDKSSFRKEALNLATQYALLRTMLAWNYKSTREAVTYGQNALTLSLETRDIQLQMSARTKFSWSLIVDQQCIRALSVMQEGEHALKNYQKRGLGPVLHPGMVGNFHSSYAIAQAENGVDSDRALGVATESPPLDSHIAFVEFTTSTQSLEIARIYSTTGNYQKTLSWIKRRIDPQTLVPCIPQSASGRIKSIGLITSAYLQSPDPDMTEIIRTWKVSMEGAKNLTIEDSYRRAMNNLTIMRHLWPKEKTIKSLMPMTSHW